MLKPKGLAHPVTPVAVDKRLEMIAEGKVQVLHKPTHGHPYKECFGFYTYKHKHLIPDGEWKAREVDCETYIKHCESGGEAATESGGYMPYDDRMKLRDWDARRVQTGTY